MVVVGFLLIFAMVSGDPPTLLGSFAMVAVVAGAFLIPLNRAQERAIHYVRRYAGFAARAAQGGDDTTTRQAEGRHTTRVRSAEATPLAKQLGRVALTWFEHRGERVGLLVDQRSRVRPWRTVYMVVVQVSGRDELPLGSTDQQERLLRRWNTALNTTVKKDFGLSGVEQLMVSRPMIEGEGAHWEFDDLLAGQQPELAAYYRQVQLLHDATATDRRMFVVLRSGGTFRTWTRARNSGRARFDVEAHFRNVIDRLPQVTHHSALTLVRVLDVDHVSALLRLLVDPAHAPAVGYREAGQSVPSSSLVAAPIEQWEEHHGHLIVNGQYTATYRVIGWPTTVIGPQFLAGALLNHQGTLRVSVVMKPEDPKTTNYVNRAGMTNAAAKAERKASMGTITTEAERLDGGHPTQRDVEQAHGNLPLMYGVYLTVITGDEASLRRAVDDLATQCDTVGVDIGRCYGWQATAYVNTLPLCRGV